MLLVNECVVLTKTTRLQAVSAAGAGTTSSEHVEGGSQSSREDLKRSLIQAVQGSRHLSEPPAVGQPRPASVKGSREQPANTLSLALGAYVPSQKKGTGRGSKLRQAVLSTLATQVEGSQPGAGGTSTQAEEAGGAPSTQGGTAAVDGAEVDAFDRTSRVMLDEILASLGPLR
jgi:hypothetical protein